MNRHRLSIPTWLAVAMAVIGLVTLGGSAYVSARDSRAQAAQRREQAARDAAAKVAANKAAAASAAHQAYLLCVSGNDFRKGDLQLWDFVIGLSSQGRPPSADSLKKIASFKAFLAKHDALRNCSSNAVPPAPPPPPSLPKPPIVTAATTTTAARSPSPRPVITAAPPAVCFCTAPTTPTTVRRHGRRRRR
jgi:hypothetical protein